MDLDGGPAAPAVDNAPPPLSTLQAPARAARQGIGRDASGALLLAPDGAIVTLAFFAGAERSVIPSLGVPVVPARAKRTRVAASPSGQTICVGEQERPEIVVVGEAGSVAGLEDGSGSGLHAGTTAT